MQRDWIGKSIGANVVFKVDGTRRRRSRCSRRGPTRCSAAPGSCSRPSTRSSTRSRRPSSAPRSTRIASEVGKRSERDRTTEAADAPKTGVLTGAFAINPVNGKQIPIWIADYVLASYGTGAVFACPAHDERDHAFATKFGLPIIEVVKARRRRRRRAYTGDGPHVNSEFLDGLDNDAGEDEGDRVARGAAARRGERALQAARLAVLAPALLGRAVPDRRARRRHGRAVPEDELPVALPQIDEYKPTARRPAAARAREGLAARSRPDDRQAGTRETNTMPQWAGSCWYYLRFLSPHARRRRVGCREKRSTGCRSTSTSAATSTRCCTCSTRGSGTRCCSTRAWSRRRSRSSGSSTRA